MCASFSFDLRLPLACEKGAVKEYSAFCVLPHGEQGKVAVGLPREEV